MLNATVLLVALAAQGTPSRPAKPPRIWVTTPSTMNPHFLANTDPVSAARFDSMGSVAMQREAGKLGVERVRALTEHWKGTRAATTVAYSGGWQTQTSNQQQYQHKAP